MPTPEIIESLEFAVVHLGVQLIVVAGHSSCGAVTAAFESDHPQGLFSQIALSSHDLEDCIAHNAKQGVKTILDRSPLILAAVESGNITVVAGVQDIASGKFDVLEQFHI